MTDNEKQLQQEREKLNRLVDEALQNGTPINEKHEIREPFRRIRRLMGKALRSKTVRAQSRCVDRLVVQVVKDGPACHLGTDSCFTNEVFHSESREAFSLSGLMELLAGRRERPLEGSYTSYLFSKGLDKILKKVGEESTEVIIAGKARDVRETVYEIADLTYHVLVLMLELGIPLEAVREELKKRHVVDSKVKQEKMT
jgi:phosphoribosyl-ATP pyrophosphohydrolase